MNSPVYDYVDGVIHSGYNGGFSSFPTYVGWFHNFGLKDAGITGEVTHEGKKCVDILKGAGTKVAIISDGIDSHPNLSHVPRQQILIPGLNGAPMPPAPIVLTDFNYMCGVVTTTPPPYPPTTPPCETTENHEGPGGSAMPCTPNPSTTVNPNYTSTIAPLNLSGRTGVYRICSGEGPEMSCWNTGQGLAIYFTTGYNGVFPSDEKLYIMGCSGSGPTRLCTGIGYGRLFSGHITSMSFMNSYSAAGSNRSSIPNFSFICQDSQIFPVIYNVEDTFCSGERENGTFCFRYNLGRDTQRGTVIAGMMAGKSGDVWYHASDTLQLTGLDVPTEGIASQISHIYNYPYLYKTYWQTTTGSCDSKMAQSLIRLRNIFKDIEDKGDVNVVVVDLNPTSFPISVESLKILAANPGTSSIMSDITNSIIEVAKTATIILVGPDDPVRVIDDESYPTYLVCNKVPRAEVTHIPNSKNYLLDSLIPNIRPHVFSIALPSVDALPWYFRHGAFGEKRLECNGMSFEGTTNPFCASGHTDEEMSWAGLVARGNSCLQGAAFAGGVAAIIHGFKKNQFPNIDVAKILKGSVYEHTQFHWILDDRRNDIPTMSRLHESHSPQEVYRRSTSKRSAQTVPGIGYAGAYNMDSMEQPQYLTSDSLSEIISLVTHDPQIYIKGWNSDHGYGTTNFSLLGRIFSSYINDKEPFGETLLPCQRAWFEQFFLEADYNPKYDLSDMRILGNTESKSGWPDIGWPPFSTPEIAENYSNPSLGPGSSYAGLESLCTGSLMGWPQATCSGKHLLGFFCSGNAALTMSGVLSVWQNSSTKIFQENVHHSNQAYKYNPQTYNGKEYYTNATPSVTAEFLFYHTGVFTGTVSVTNPCISGLISGVHTGIYSDIIKTRCLPPYSAVHTNSYFSNCISATCLQSDGTFDNPGQRNLYYTGTWTGTYMRSFSNAMIAGKVIYWNEDEEAWVMGHGLGGEVVDISGHTGESQLAIMEKSSPGCPIGFFSPFDDAQSFVKPSGMAYHAFAIYSPFHAGGHGNGPSGDFVGQHNHSNILENSVPS